MVEIATSILNVNPENSIKTFYNLEEAHTDYFHIDVMDGIFVEDDTEDRMLKYTEYLKHMTLIPIDVHLMVKKVLKFINMYLDLNPNTISFHYEAVGNKEEILELIKYIKENNCKVGIAISPKTEIEKIFDFLPYIHQVIVMTVEPGKGGQRIIESTIEKISELKKYINENNIDIDIEADGGIKIDDVSKIKEAGANIIVAGTQIINSDNYKETIDLLKNK